MTRKIIFYNKKNNGKYEYEPSSDEEYENLEKEIIEDLDSFFMGDNSTDDGVHFCKFDDGKVVNTTYRLIRLNDSISFNHKDFSLKDYIEKYSDSSVENELIDIATGKKKRYDNGEDMLIKGINFLILGYLISKIVAMFKN